MIASSPVPVRLSCDGFVELLKHSEFHPATPEVGEAHPLFVLDFDNLPTLPRVHEHITVSTPNRLHHFQVEDVCFDAHPGQMRQITLHQITLRCHYLYSEVLSPPPPL